MKRYSGGEKVAGGYYWNLKAWEIVPVRAKVGALPGAPADKYAELPLPAIPIVVVLMASMAMFFTPAIGFVMVFYALWTKLARKGPAASQEAETPAKQEAAAPEAPAKQDVAADGPGAPKG